MPPRRRWGKGAALTAVFLGGLFLDLYTKDLALRHLSFRSPVEIVRDVFELRLAENRAVGFSLLHTVPFAIRQWLVYVLNFIILSVLTAFLVRWRRRSLASLVPLVLVMSGAVGNLVNRLTRDFAVVDFIHLHYRQVWSWPIFNFADCLIVLGVGMFLWVNRREFRA
ncbi:MAG: signal peptidase II [Bacteroidota bacterium]